MGKKNIVVFFGGHSSRYYDSLASAGTVISSMNEKHIRPVPVGITREGGWYYYQGEISKIVHDTWFESLCRPALISPVRNQKELIVFYKKDMKRIPVDAVFSVLYGGKGEVQGICEMAGIPVVGCDMKTIALCADKDRARKAVTGIRVPASAKLYTGFKDEQAETLADAIGYPLFIRPANTDSPHGVSRLTARDGLSAAVRKAFEYSSCVYMEEAVLGVEIGCAVLGNKELISGPPDEIEVQDGFFIRSETDEPGASKVHTPARISGGKAAEIKETAERIYRILGCRGFARIDFFLRPDGELVFNGAETMPELTPDSRYPKMMKAAGLSLEALISLMISLTEERV